MPKTVTFEDPAGDEAPVELTTVEVPKDLPDHEQRIRHIPEPDPNYVDLGMLYKLAKLEHVRRTTFADTPPRLTTRRSMSIVTRLMPPAPSRHRQSGRPS